jgi:hypothetical protein
LQQAVQFGPLGLHLGTHVTQFGADVSQHGIGGIGYTVR